MRYYTAVQVDDGWHYASTSKQGGSAIGYCSEHEPHETESQARRCWSRYLRDNLELRENATSWATCGVHEPERCPNPAKNLAEVRGYFMHSVVLCAQHFNEETAVRVLGLDKPAGDAWMS